MKHRGVDRRQEWVAIFIKSGFSGLRSYKKKSYYSSKVLSFFVILILSITVLWLMINKRIMPVVQSMARYEANMAAIQCINKGMNHTLSQNKITTQDLLFYDYNESGEIVSWNVNSIMINQLCTDVADSIVNELQMIGTIPLKIPSGTITGTHIFSNIGPQINVKILPIGSASVDYRNELRATGINQVNHIVWLNIEIMMQVMIPLSSEQMVVQRKVILVDKVISGKVPSSYIQTNQSEVLKVIPKAGEGNQ